MVHPRCQGEESFFGQLKLEYPRLKKKHDIRWMDILLGNVAEIQNFLRITKINLWSNLATKGRGVHLHTIVDRDAEALQERG